MQISGGGITIGALSIAPPVQYNLFSWGFQDTLAPNLGLGAVLTSRSSPTQVGGAGQWNSVNGSIAIKYDGTMWVWGNNTAGTSGKNIYSDPEAGPFFSSPVQVGSDTWLRVYSSMEFPQRRFAINTNNKLFAWGSNASGVLGINAPGGGTVYRSSPVQVGTSDWLAVSFGAGSEHTLGIMSDGTLWSWGRNQYGQLGINSSGFSTYRSSPVQVDATYRWASVATSTEASFAIRNDGTLWSWGTNVNGLLGRNLETTASPASSPVQVGTGTNWLMVVSAYSRVAALKTDGTLWTWGNNTNGELGLNDRVSRSSPVQVGAATDWGFIVGSGRQSNNEGLLVARKTNNSIWAWGYNGYGTINADKLNRSSPTQIGSATDWSSIAVESAGYTIGTRVAAV